MMVHNTQNHCISSIVKNSKYRKYNHSETESVSETLCFLDDGQSPETQWVILKLFVAVHNTVKWQATWILWHWKQILTSFSIKME
jgi:hypothetical protein